MSKVKVIVLTKLEMSEKDIHECFTGALILTAGMAALYLIFCLWSLKLGGSL